MAQQLAYLRRFGDIPQIGIEALYGDLYDYPDCHKRGGTGAVWHAFAAVTRLDVGVLGNHDTLNQPSDLPANAHLLDGDLLEIEGIRVGGGAAALWVIRNAIIVKHLLTTCRCCTA